MRSMRSKAMKMIAYLAVVLILASVLPANALAEKYDKDMTQRGVRANSNGAALNMTKDQVRDRINTSDNAPCVEPYMQNRTKTANLVRANVANTAAQYRSAKERMATVRNNYSDAQKDYKDLKIKINNKKVSADSEEVIGATRAYMNQTIEYMVTHLRTVQENIENTGGDSGGSEIIEGYIEQLEQQKMNVGSAQTKQELENTAKEIRNILKDAEKRAKYFAGKSVNNRLNNFLVKSGSLSLRLEDEIKRLNAAGENTEELEEMLAEYNELIGEAKQNQKHARDTFQNQNDDAVNEARQYMHQATGSIHEANCILKDIFNELKSYRHGFAVLDGNGTLTAEGNGTAVLSGDLTLNITATDAELVIKDLAGDSNITISGDYVEINADSEDYDNCAMIYHNFTGTVHITGSRLTIMLHGNDVNFTAEGKGSVILSGTGIYKVEKAGESSGDIQWATVVTTPENEAGTDDLSGSNETDSDGNITDGNTTGGNTTDWNTTDGNSTDWNTTDGNSTDWNATDGNLTDCNTTDGNLTDCNTTDGNGSN
ncbi:MAG TPA: hypothetical protein C5S50_11745 [Methanosarcinaceae archaeon]|nr:hypothetical protein [Methanosarcinaceae archaeon]